MANGIITPLPVKYTEVSVTVNPNSSVSPWTHYGDFNPSIPSGSTIIGVVVTGVGSSVRAIAVVRSNTQIYVYSMTSDNVSVRVAYI